MSTTQDQTQSTLPPAEPPAVPDGKSDLPTSPTDYPAVPSGGSGDSGPSTTK